jgi:hypothetical protein
MPEQVDLRWYFVPPLVGIHTIPPPVLGGLTTTGVGVAFGFGVGVGVAFGLGVGVGVAFVSGVGVFIESDTTSKVKLTTK